MKNVTQLRLARRVLLLLLCTSMHNARAFEVGVGTGATTQGDGVIHPSLHSWTSTTFGLSAAASLSGQKNSAFSQQLATARLAYSAVFPKSKTLFAHIGVGGVFQRTMITSLNENGGQLTEWSRAAGVALGAHWAFKARKSFVLRAGWDSLFIPPGKSTIYLTFGHIQSVYGGMGWSF